MAKTINFTVKLNIDGKESLVNVGKDARKFAEQLGQLAAALPSVTGQAAQLGVSFTEMLAVMSTLTGVTGNTSEVATQLGSVLTALTKESTKSHKMADELGISFNAASIKAAGGLRNYLQELDKTVTAYANKNRAIEGVHLQ